MRIIPILFIILFSLKVSAGTIPASVIEECTTNEKTYFETRLRVNDSVNKDLKRAAVLKSLGMSTSNQNFGSQMLKGQWFYERESDAAIYTGYKIRSHYLSVAIIYTPKGLNTIICNSANLKQKKKSIHRKAPVWKETLNTNIRIEIANISMGHNKSNIHVQNLNNLKSLGFVTDEEYKKIMNRIEPK